MFGRPPSARSSSAVSPPALSFEQCLGKTRRLPDGCIVPGRTVEAHCRITWAVALELLFRMPALLRELFPDFADIVALLHDVGKVSPDLQYKIYSAVGALPASLPQLRAVSLDGGSSYGGHAAVSHACLLDAGAPSEVAAIAGQHHGRATEYRPSASLAYGGLAWQEERRKLLVRLVGENPSWPCVEESQKPLLSGLTVVADWIASGPAFDDPDEDWRPLVCDAVTRAGFVLPEIRPGLRFEDIFPFAPNEMQKAFAASVRGPGVYLLEAPMGLGKTEAALYAAYTMLAGGQSGGVYFALPTQLTSNRIHRRMDRFLDRILVHKGAALLLHGKAWLERFMRRELGADAAPEGAWFSQGRRGILAPFAVGTVDQALMAAMHVRHSALRAFGLAGKTVILDEVHSYDAYTGGILEQLVRLLLACNCTVIILSATLTARRRALFMGMESGASDYPLISARPLGDDSCAETAAPPPPSAEVLLYAPAVESDAVEEALKRAEQGQRVLWVENTVKEAQNVYGLLAARAASMSGVEIGLLHSRFTPADRKRNEDLWTERYAPHAAGRGLQGCILAGTQVLEQSLDIDADFMITRFCPTDMLLQRMGRLWRHGAATPRPPDARREVWLLHPDADAAARAPEQAFGPSGSVYAPYVLCRSLELWHGLDAVRLPDHIRSLLEQTYAERRETSAPLAAALRRLEEEKRNLGGAALRSCSALGRAVGDSDPPTRMGSRPEADVLLLRRAYNKTHPALLLADGTEVRLAGCAPDAGAPPDARENTAFAAWRRRSDTAARLTLNVVRVPEQDAPPHVSVPWLKPWLHCDNLRVAVIGHDDALLRHDGSRLSGMNPRYRDDLGYLAE